MPISTTRRQAMIGAAGMGLATFGAYRPAFAHKPTKPNIIFILADDLGYADVSCYGRRDYTTPAIDSLAAQGMLFTQSYANSAVCSATRTAIITGRYQDRLPIGLEEPLVNRDVGLPPSHPTLPSKLKDSGYATYLVGKWHLGKLPKYGPLKSGYGHFWGFRGGALDYFTHDVLGTPDLWDNDSPVETQGYLTDLMGDEALRIIDGHSGGDKPFFISLHFNAPHWPWEGPDDETEARRLAEMKMGASTIYHFDGGDLETYGQMVMAMDRQIGRIIAGLERAGLADNTIVIFTSDNGGERFSDTWPFSGKKTELLEGGLRIPTIVRWPGYVAQGSSSEQTIMSMDWMPTLLNAAGADNEDGYWFDGIDLRPALSGAPPVHRTLCWRYLNMRQEACRSGDWKYLKIWGNTFLFNIAKDPLERANLKDREPDIYARLVQEYNSWNATMLPLDLEAFTGGFTGAEIPDNFGVTQTRNVPEE